MFKICCYFLNCFGCFFIFFFLFIVHAFKDYVVTGFERVGLDRLVVWDDVVDVGFAVAEGCRGVVVGWSD